MPDNLNIAIKKSSEIWTNPILRWAGSKKKLLPILLKNIPNNINRYVEPFCGSACLFFALRPQKAILSDLNNELMHTYAQLKKHPKILHRLASSYSTENEEYLRIRAQNPEALTPIDRAARFIYLNRHCFNGVYRTNRQGQFNVPQGNRTGAFPESKHFLRCSIALRDAELKACNYKTIITRVKKGDFVYLDPPYAKADSRNRGEYGPKSFTYADLPDMLSQLAEINRSGATFLFSYCLEPNHIEYFRENWNVEVIKVQRHVAGFSKHRNKVSEILVSNRKITV
ncbi:DNA adenine methylase [Microbulbifer zhoushanensis]|uniref:DNA adenine methylase n=1 Tax=Microbulbifer zhoushanensis TaxID=2904254 RepID=UPI001F012492|nr:Dam family site-specific DNA-(adenine-N6)-methyltransferase [Microbulbifer zhoushanensis]